MEDKYAGSSLGHAANQTSPASPFDRLSSAVSDLRDLQKTASMLADRLAGPRPSEPTQAGSGNLKEIGGGGLIDGVERQTNSIREIQADIYANLARIENRL